MSAKLSDMPGKHDGETDAAQPSLDSPIGIARLQEIYTRTAAFYDGLVAAKQAKAKQAALALLDRRPDEHFLEVGVGTAWAFSRLIAESGADRTVGLDLAPGMLDVARRRLSEDAGVAHPPLVLGDGRRLPFAGASFDCLLATYTFEVLPAAEIAPVLSECRRVLRPGGRLVAVNLTEGEGEDAAFTADWKRRFVADPEYFGGARPLLLAPALADAGFVTISRRYVGRDWPSEVLLAYRPPEGRAAS